MYEYKRTEPQLYTVGSYSSGKWEPESDWDTKEEAATRVHYLNGGENKPQKRSVYVETITEFAYEGNSFRIWKELPEGKEPTIQRLQVIDKVKELVDIEGKGLNLMEVAEKVLEIEGVNAVQVNSTGIEVGVVLYKDWP
jgi:hypothetical protein